MKVLVYPHSMSLGGSQLNAVELAAAVNKLGHETVVFGQDGPLARRVEALGLEFIAAPAPRRRPSPSVIRALVQVVDSRHIDVMHGYEWPPALECTVASRKRPDTTATATVMSMAVAPFLPRQLPLQVGTEQIAAAERGFGRSAVGLMEPPVDLQLNQPDLAVGQRAFRRRWVLDDRKFTIVLVSRLAHQLKLEGVLTAMDAAGQLAPAIPLQLVIVGDGPAEEEVVRHAGRVNRSTGERTVILTGGLEDPRAAYAIADVALGMGGSALRAMAFAKPLVVQGEQGYWKLLTPQSLPEFLWQGWYGVGGVDPVKGLAGILASLLTDPGTRAHLGAFCLRTVQERFSLEKAGQRQVAFYQAARSSVATDSPASDIAAAGRFLRHHAVRRTKRLLGNSAEEDFNARPLAARPTVDRQERQPLG